MNGAVSMLRGEYRRHLLLNAGLLATCFVGGTVVTNERGLFVPIDFGGLSSTAQAFATMLTPARFLHPDRFLRDVRLASAMSSLDPFDITADSRDLRRRLMNAMEQMPEQADAYNRQIAAMGGEPLTPSELASNDIPGTETGTAGSPGASSGDSSTASPLTGGNNDILPSRSLIGNNPGNLPINQASNPGDGVTPVPEPSSWAMLLLGFGIVGYLQRTLARRRKMQDAAG